MSYSTAARAAAGPEAEAERRHTSLEPEIDSAREVQVRLLPGVAPRLSSLDHAVISLPARGVGGDYYDFLKLSPRRVAIALADVSGKGVPAALMMAALQASLRSHYTLGNAPLATRLQSVNRLFYDCTAPGHFATLFLGEYDDRTERLRYANCGHVPPLVLRGDGNIERLEPTAMLLGVERDWACAVAEKDLKAGDTLFLCTDGASEASSPEGELFGEERLARTLRGALGLPLPALLEAVAAAVREFAAGRLADDLTLVAARPRRPAAPARLVRAARGNHRIVNG